MTQDQLDRNLRWGIVFSIVWLMGIGSLVALVLGFKARRAIKVSNGRLIGIGRTRFCLIVGGLGIIFWFPIVIIGVVNRLLEN
jgi:hypothetical protein